MTFWEGDIKFQYIVHINSYVGIDNDIDVDNDVGVNADIAILIDVDIDVDLISRTLIGGTRFLCIKCHLVQLYKPRIYKVALNDISPSS